MNNKIELGTTLSTRDGRKIGNAKITEVATDNFKVTTDIGFEVGLTADEIRGLFYIDI